MGEILGPFRCPGATQDVPGTPGAEKVTKSSSFPRSFLFLWPPKITHFRFFFDFRVVFWGYFLEAVLEGLRAAFLKDFGVIFELFFRVFLKMLGGARF